ncbi:hypothetical protein M422DRAFT_773546 [Sphaerobolus stellatus SS14]|nr:hypothetical protein M422DRAFT_773546 [Sphaerobolus stellatus SS14]
MASPIGNVIERKGSSKSSSAPPAQWKPPAQTKTGFPVVEHRSKAPSAFKRARQHQQDIQTAVNPSSPSLPKNGASLIQPGVSRNFQQHVPSAEGPEEEISKSNDAVLQGMSEDQLYKERQEIIEHFGSGIEELMKKVRQAKERRAANKALADNIDDSELSVKRGEDPTTQAISPTPTRKLRFAEPTDADIYVYESHPSSPKRTMGLLPPVPGENETGSSDITSLGTFGSTSVPARFRDTFSEPVEEGTPEDIHRRYFPAEAPPQENPSLAWMLGGGDSAQSENIDNSQSLLDAPVPSEARYSLSGIRLTPSEIRDLPTHLGLHHHASRGNPLTDNPAGYTLNDLLLLSRSSVPAQRANILGVLAKILKFTSEEYYGPCGTHLAPDKRMSEEELSNMRRDILDASLDASGEKGGVGLHAMDALWESIVGFTLKELDITHPTQLPLVNLEVPSKFLASKQGLGHDSSAWTLSSSSVSFLSSLPLASMIPVLRSHLLSSPSPLSTPHSQVLDILFLLAHFPHHALTMVDNEHVGLISAMMDPHLGSSYDTSSTAEPIIGTTQSINLLQMLARTGREAAKSLLGPADILLRYIATPFPNLVNARLESQDIYRVDLARETAVFYSLLTQYGLYAHVASAAQTEFSAVATWVSTALRQDPLEAILLFGSAYVRLLEILAVCAQDPHKTTPTHDILWSQVEGWKWIEWIFDIASGWVARVRTSSQNSIRIGLVERFWANVFHCLAALVEGASINGVRGGEQEKAIVFARLRSILDAHSELSGIIRVTTHNVKAWLQESNFSTAPQDFLNASELLLGVSRLRLALSGDSLGDTDFGGISQDIHDICIWYVDRHVLQQVFQRTLNVREDVLETLSPISNLLAIDLRLSIRDMGLSLGTTEKRHWMRYALRILGSLLPGDEDYAKDIIKLLCNSVDSSFIREVCPLVRIGDNWDEDGLRILLPFYLGSFSWRIGEDEPSSQSYLHCIAPLHPRPDSLSGSSSLLMPSLNQWSRIFSSYEPGVLLPLREDWPTWPLNHLLRSGSSPVFKNLPPNWDANETEVVRASLLLSLLAQRLGNDPDPELSTFSKIKNETIFACMKVFMLEQGQQQIDSGAEVFRNSLVTQLMEELLEPFTAARAQQFRESHPSDSFNNTSSLDIVSRTFLGNQTPFYQFYTDFVALYDAISFSYPLFGRLILPPLASFYEPDYRKLLFGDYNHILRTIKVEPQNVYTTDIREYFWPVEENTTMIGWYVRTATTPAVEGFVRWMAVHHLACNIWPDLEGSSNITIEKASKLLKAVMVRGDHKIVRDVVFYRQTRSSPCLPPQCYEKQGHDDLGQQRWHFIKSMADPDMEKRLEGLFVENV